MESHLNDDDDDDDDDDDGHLERLTQIGRKRSQHLLNRHIYLTTETEIHRHAYSHT